MALCIIGCFKRPTKIKAINSLEDYLNILLYLDHKLISENKVQYQESHKNTFIQIAVFLLIYIFLKIIVLLTMTFLKNVLIIKTLVLNLQTKYNINKKEE